MTAISFIERGRSFIVRYERRLSSLALLTGFLIDSFTLTRIDFWGNHLLIFSYLALATLCIFLLQIKEAGRIRKHFFLRLASLFPLAIQFAFGALLSALTVFYVRSASLSGSLFFILFLGGMMVGNELLRSRYARLEFQFSILFVIIFAFMIFYVPIVLSTLGAATFLLSGALSLLVMTLLLFALFRLTPQIVSTAARALAASIGGIYLLVNVLYFTNIIPPIPLSLKEADVYHFVAKEGEQYVGFGEEEPWWARYFSRERSFHRTKGEPTYFYSAVFAPTKITIPIYHEWQFYDEATRAWETRSRISFPIVGGRESGYRGYSMKSELAPGRWRVRVTTERGQILGSTAFFVVEVEAPPPSFPRVLQ